MAADASGKDCYRLIICVSTAIGNIRRRRAVRTSWFQYKHDASGPLSAAQRASVHLLFAVSAADSPELRREQAEHGDMLQLDVPDGYAHLWRKVLAFISHIATTNEFAFFMHVDDDSFVRLDLLLPLLESSPRERFYWGYIWDGTGNRVTVPIRNAANKSYMPVEQYPDDQYPPFASGCGFVLSADLVHALLRQPLPDYRLLDPPFGIHLCSDSARCVVAPPVVPVHCEAVRPYRGIPMFHPKTIIQHYLQPEEMRPLYRQALEHAQRGGADGSARDDDSPAAQLYASLVEMGLLRR